MIVFASVQTISRTDADAILETSRTSFPSLVDTQRPRPELPGSLHENAKFLLSGAHEGLDGDVPVSFGVANRSSRVSSLSCAFTDPVIDISKIVIIHVCQKEICFMFLL
jgi:hypothetical protein